MDDFSIKPRDSVSRASPRRANVSVRTELAPSQSVTAAASSSTPHTSETPNDQNAREALINPQGQTIVDRERDINNARRNARRAPDEALLRMRAYNRNVPHDDPDQESHADIKA